MIVLDTHALYWMSLNDARIGRSARLCIDLAWQENQLAVSAASFWELTMLLAKKRIQMPTEVGPWRQGLLNDGLVEIPIDGEIAVHSQSIQDFHKDPADRFIVATCLKGHSLVTSDRKILAWSGKLDRIDACK